MQAESSSTVIAGWSRPSAATLCVLTATAMALGLGAEVVHRLRLFWFTYGGEPGLNHVADGYFSSVYLASLVAMVMGLAAARLHRRSLWRCTAGTVAVVNGILCGAFLVMHHTATLVTYSEFVTLHGP